MNYDKFSELCPRYLTFTKVRGIKLKSCNNDQDYLNEPEYVEEAYKSKIEKINPFNTKFDRLSTGKDKTQPMKKKRNGLFSDVALKGRKLKANYPISSHSRNCVYKQYANSLKDKKGTQSKIFDREFSCYRCPEEASISNSKLKENTKINKIWLPKHSTFDSNHTQMDRSKLRIYFQESMINNLNKQLDTMKINKPKNLFGNEGFPQSIVKLKKTTYDRGTRVFRFDSTDSRVEVLNKMHKTYIIPHVYRISFHNTPNYIVDLINCSLFLHYTLIEMNPIRQEYANCHINVGPTFSLGSNLNQRYVNSTISISRVIGLKFENFFVFEYKSTEKIVKSKGSLIVNDQIVQHCLSEFTTERKLKQKGTIQQHDDSLYCQLTLIRSSPPEIFDFNSIYYNCSDEDSWDGISINNAFTDGTTARFDNQNLTSDNFYNSDDIFGSGTTIDDTFGSAQTLDDLTEDYFFPGQLQNYLDELDLVDYVNSVEIADLVIDVPIYLELTDYEISGVNSKIVKSIANILTFKVRTYFSLSMRCGATPCFQQLPLGDLKSQYYFNWNRSARNMNFMNWTFNQNNLNKTMLGHLNKTIQSLVICK